MTDDRLRRALNATPEERQRLVETAEAVAPRTVYVVAGGTPAARALAESLDDPVVRARLEEGMWQLSEAVGITVAAALEAFRRAAEAYGEAFSKAYPALVDAGVLPDPGPEDPRERALWLRQTRGTGPDRQLQHRHRPRRVS